MNETEKDRILRMVSEGTLKPSEAAHLLAALADESAPAEPKPGENNKAKPKEKKQLIEVQMQRPDGSHYTIEVPPNLVPMFLKMAGVAIRESVRSAAQDAWAGFKVMVRNKTDEIKTNVKTRVSGGSKEETPAVSPEQEQQAEARRRILQMVQNGRINAADASRLIEQLDALAEYQKTHPTPQTPTASAK
ncbi:MAG TPA: hypothetical protein VFB38_10520 [Chthonomonadaceae bacterium]|nr:hypothetical protein [Chthonomonadaceae bacterium]